MSVDDFVIKNGVFYKYKGPQVEVLEIPEGVVSIDRSAFSSSCKNMKNCKKIVFPSSVKEVCIVSLSYSCSYFKALEEVVFKGDIERIGERAFNHINYYHDELIGKVGIKKIVFEGHVGEIEEEAFFLSRITSVYAPKGIDVLGNGVFEDCRNLKEVYIPGLKKMGERCFRGCHNLTKLDVPSTCKIAYNAISGCDGLANKDGLVIFNGVLYDVYKTKYSIPEEVSVIEKDTISENDELIIPSNVKTIKEQSSLNWIGCRLFLHPDKTNIGFSEDYFRTDQKISGKGFLTLLEKQWIKEISAKDWAYLYLYQTGKTLENILKECKFDTNMVIDGMLEALEKFGKETHFVKAAEYIIENIYDVNADNMKKMCDFFDAKKAEKAVSLLKSHLELAENDIYIEWKKAYNEHLLDKSIQSNWGDEEVFAKIRLLDSEELAPAFIVKCAIVPYLDLYTGRPKHIGKYKNDYIDVKIIELADKAAGLLNINDVQELLEKDLERQLLLGRSAWLIPYGRYASETQISTLISNMRKWEEWRRYGSTGRSNIITARGALMLSETREAMMNIDKKGLLDKYAELRGTDADSIRDSVLSDFGLDASGRKEYDLGSKKVIVSLAHDLTLDIYDTAEDKIVKSIPKKGTDPKLVEKAMADYAEIKKNAKKVVKERNDILFADFLSGKTSTANSWIASYTQNPLLRRVAELVVWNQGKKTFILTPDGCIDCNGNSYEINNKTDIGVAHPLEMKKNEIEAWQRYFTSRGLKQPFSQIWEPVVDKDSIREDRYKDCLIPFYRFRNQKKHGIEVNDFDFHNEIYINFTGCNANVERIDWKRHEINNDDNFEVTSFKFREYTRQVNHIVAYLDRITVSGRILKDDTSISMYLEDFTLAQITEFINLAMDNKSTNCLAVLIDYKNNKYATYDPMDAFTLE